MAKFKLYESKEWLKQKYITERRSIDEISKLCGVSYNTIKAAIKRHGL